MSRKKAGMSANAKWGIAFLIEIVVMFFMVVGYFFFYANRKLDNINRPTNWDDSKENLDINEDDLMEMYASHSPLENMKYKPRNH